MSINFYLEKRPNKAGEKPIRAQVSIRSSVLISTIGYSVNPDVWNGEQVDERLVAAWYKKQKKSDKDAVMVGRGQRKPGAAAGRREAVLAPWDGWEAARRAVPLRGSRGTK